MKIMHERLLPVVAIYNKIPGFINNTYKKNYRTHFEYCVKFFISM